MADVTVDIAGRRYRLACEDGEERHLRALATALDVEATKLQRRMQSPPDEARLLLMVALMMADRAAEAEEGASRTATAGAASDGAEAETLRKALAEAEDTAARNAAEIRELRAARAEAEKKAAEAAREAEDLRAALAETGEDAAAEAARTERIAALAERIEGLTAALAGR